MLKWQPHRGKTLHYAIESPMGQTAQQLRICPQHEEALCVADHENKQRGITSVRLKRKTRPRNGRHKDAWTANGPQSHLIRDEEAAKEILDH